jgi:hypothetical protein
MQSQRLIDLEHDRGGNQPYPLTEALHGDRPDLLGLSLRVLPQATGHGWQANLNWVDPPNVRCDWKYRDYTAPEAGRDGVGAIVAHDERWTAFTRLGAAAGIDIDDSNLASPHQEGRPSAEVVSHNFSSPLAAHSRQASSYAAPKPDARSNLTALWTTADRDS